MLIMRNFSFCHNVFKSCRSIFLSESVKKNVKILCLCSHYHASARVKEKEKSYSLPVRVVACLPLISPPPGIYQQDISGHSLYALLYQVSEIFSLSRWPVIIKKIKHKNHNESSPYDYAAHEFCQYFLTI